MIRAGRFGTREWWGGWGFEGGVFFCCGEVFLVVVVFGWVGFFYDCNSSLNNVDFS